MDLLAPGSRSATPTYTVSQLGAEIRELLRQALHEVWLVGELQRLVVRPSGHRYFELVEKGDGDAIVGKLDAVLWRGESARVLAELARHGQALADGVAIRCRVAIDFYPPHGRLQVQVREIDPAFLLGELARRREETLAELTRAGLLEANRALPLTALPLRVALVTSQGSAASHDFLATLAESGYGFRVVLLHAAVQGAAAEREVASALAAAPATGADCVVLVRGGGSKSDLAAFDSREIAYAVARSPLPVLTGLGHEIDQSVADLVAHRSFKTPTKVGEFLVARVQDAELAVARLAERLGRAARLPLAAARERWLVAERRAILARGRLAAARLRLSALAAGLARAAPRALGRGESALAEQAWRLVGAARARLAAESARLDGRARLARGLAPERTLARGFSITRSETGAVVRDAASLDAGHRLVTTLARGTVWSRVEER